MAHALPPIVQSTLSLYALLWSGMIPLMPLFPRLKVGLDERLFNKRVTGKIDLWIQAASVGESFLARSIINQMAPFSSLKVLISTQTEQGYDILKKEQNQNPNFKGVRIGYFPFDHPRIMKTAVHHLRPRVMVLLETEIWPGLLFALKRMGCAIIVINGRLSPKSLKHYRLLPNIWPHIAPDTILAISSADKKRYRQLFSKSHIETMPNIKFDQVRYHPIPETKKNPLAPLLPKNDPFVVLGSIRKQEEKMVMAMIQTLVKAESSVVIGLVPRHLERIDSWKAQLNKAKIPFILRSQLKERVTRKQVILWDTFGELQLAYALSKAVFIGGTLSPLGGQNFLEALTSGISPIIGPFWDNFHWVGSTIIQSGMVRKVETHHEAISLILSDLKSPKGDRDRIRKKALTYFSLRSGGTKMACSTIRSHLSIR